MIEKEKNYITLLGLTKLQNELDHLVKTERPEMTKVVSWAASLGDRSENADYLYGKKRLREIDRRIRFLTSRINLAVVVGASDKKVLKVQFGVSVRVQFEDDEEKIFHIVGVDEVDTKCGKISWRSPIGAALMGKSPGERVVAKTPSGEVEMELLSINYEGD